MCVCVCEYDVWCECVYVYVCVLTSFCCLRIALRSKRLRCFSVSSSLLPSVATGASGDRPYLAHTIR